MRSLPSSGPSRRASPLCCYGLRSSGWAPCESFVAAGSSSPASEAAQGRWRSSGCQPRRASTSAFPVSSTSRCCQHSLPMERRVPQASSGEVPKLPHTRGNSTGQSRAGHTGPSCVASDHSLTFSRRRIRTSSGFRPVRKREGQGQIAPLCPRGLLDLWQGPQRTPRRTVLRLRWPSSISHRVR